MILLTKRNVKNISIIRWQRKPLYCDSSSWHLNLLHVPQWPLIVSYMRLPMNSRFNVLGRKREKYWKLQRALYELLFSWQIFDSIPGYCSSTMITLLYGGSKEDGHELDWLDSNEDKECSQHCCIHLLFCLLNNRTKRNGRMLDQGKVISHQYYTQTISRNALPCKYTRASPKGISQQRMPLMRAHTLYSILQFQRPYIHCRNFVLTRSEKSMNILIKGSCRKAFSHRKFDVYNEM